MTVAFDPRSSEFRADPFPFYRALQDEEPVHRSERLGGWVLTRYEDVKFALTDPRFSADRITPFMANLPEPVRARIAGLGESLGEWVVFNDPPKHTRLRAMQSKTFAAPAISALRPRIHKIANAILDRIIQRGDQMEAIADFAYPLPVTVIAEMVGVPLDALDRFKVWSDELALFVGSSMGSPDKWDRAQKSLNEMSEFFRGIIASRRAHLEDDLVSGLISAEEQGEARNPEELVTNMIGLVFAGHETTTNLIGNGLITLLRHPASLRLLRDDPGLIPAAVEEILRYDGPVGAIVRIAREEIEIEGHVIRRGERVFNMINAANRDPRQFKEPDRFDLLRADNAHIAFGQGIHYCLGAGLARAEGQIAFEAILHRMDDLTLLSGGLEWRDSLVLRGVKSLPIRFRRAGT